jgi:hypothetical protein
VLCVDPSTFVDGQRVPGETVFDDARPDHVAIPAHDSVSSTLLVGLVWKECRVNATEHHPRAACPGHLTDRVAAQRIARVNADAHDVAGGHGGGVERVQGFVHDAGIAPPDAGGRGALGLIRWTRGGQRSGAWRLPCRRRLRRFPYLSCGRLSDSAVCATLPSATSR